MAAGALELARYLNSTGSLVKVGEHINTHIYATKVDPLIVESLKGIGKGLNKVAGRPQVVFVDYESLYGKPQKKEGNKELTARSATRRHARPLIPDAIAHPIDPVFPEILDADIVMEKPIETHPPLYGVIMALPTQEERTAFLYRRWILEGLLPAAAGIKVCK